MRTIIIAEAGVNHNGDMAIAEKLVDIAAQSGADIVKFQTFQADNLVTKSAKKADYQLAQTSNSESHYQMLKQLELTKEMHTSLIDLTKKSGIEFCSTPFDIESLEYLIELDIKRIKIPSGEITNMPLLREIGATQKPIILSSGMAVIQEIEAALNILVASGASKEMITVLHCNTEYPIPMDEINLNAMSTIKDKLGVNVGFSDHSIGIEASIAAVALGATMIEKHFPLDRNLPGPDHLASIEPEELNELVKSVRNIEKAMGDGIKGPSKSEMKNIPIARKSIVAKKKIIKGEIYSYSNLTTKRPGTGISPMDFDKLINQKADRNYEADELIQTANDSQILYQD